MIKLIMGKPGVGKSTYAALVAMKYHKKGIDVYSTHHIANCYKLDVNWLGINKLENCCIIIDEAQLIFDNRNFKEFKDNWKDFFSQHRHYSNDIYIISQSFEDLDIKLRRLAQRIYLIQPTIFFLTHIKIQEVRMKFGVNEEQTDIVTMYKITFFDTRYKLKRKAWKYFNSYERKNLPNIPYKIKWGNLVKKKPEKPTKAKREIKLKLLITKVVDKFKNPPKDLKTEQPESKENNA